MIIAPKNRNYSAILSAVTTITFAAVLLATSFGAGFCLGCWSGWQAAVEDDILSLNYQWSNSNKVKSTPLTP